MADYAFATIWHFAAPVAPVWSAITKVEHWPQWWRGVEAVVRLRDGDHQGIGAIHHYRWKSKLPYRLSFTMETTRVEPLQRIEGQAQGELQGTGCWTFTETAQGTTVRYDWHVRTTKAWMNLVAPLARPLFAWNHDMVMAWGEEGLIRLLAATPGARGRIEATAKGMGKPFDPDRVAFFEKAGWEAYYDRRWLRVLWLMVQLNREQFGMSLLTAIAAARDIVRAGRVFAPQDNDLPATLEHLRRSYAKARRARPTRASADTLARLELAYWIVHRRLAVARKANPAQAEPSEPLSPVLAMLHAALFDATPAAMEPSARLRAQAAVTVDRITGRYSADVAADWREVERLLRQAYRAVLEAPCL